MSIFKLSLPNGDIGTGFAVDWRGRRAIATCDHVFLGASVAQAFRMQLRIGDNETDCEVRRHPTADAAIVLPDTQIADPALPLLRAFSPPLSGTNQVSVTGYDVAQRRLVTFAGSEHGQRHGTKTFEHPSGNSKQYMGWLIANSLPGVPGVSGAPVRTISEGGVIGLYSCSQQSRALTDAFHAAHLDEVP